jgi:hypothetical protein
MRRYLFSLLSIVALAAVVPAIALAHSGDRRGDRHDQGRDRVEIRHRHHRRHHRVEHFREHAAKPGRAAADAGTVKSFQAGVLTITLTDNSTVSGRVNRNTEVECEAMDDHFTRDDGGPGPSGNGGGDQGDRGDQGDDRGDRGDRNDASDNDANDDNGNDNPQACAMALRTPGTHVGDATLILSGAGAAWDRVDLDI